MFRWSDLPTAQQTLRLFILSYTEKTDTAVGRNLSLGGRIMKPIRIALTKGRLESKTIDMLERLGYDCTNARKKRQKTDHAHRRR